MGHRHLVPQFVTPRHRSLPNTATNSHLHSDADSLPHSDGFPKSLLHSDADSLPHSDAFPKSLPHSGAFPKSLPHSDSFPKPLCDPIPKSLRHAETSSLQKRVRQAVCTFGLAVRVHCECYAGGFDRPATSELGDEGDG
jgi:hypothetical protein